MSRRRLLIIDDSATARALLRVLLMNASFDIEETSNPHAALERLTREHFDVVIADFTMPDLNGIELLTLLRAHARRELASLPVILLTAESDVKLEQQSLSAGANAFLRKPVKPEQLRDTLARVLG